MLKVNQTEKEIKMKLKKLNMRGFSHDLVLVAFIVVIAVVGVGFLVVSHADSCAQTTSGSTSATTTATTCPASAPVTTASLSGYCTIGNVPSKLKYKAIVSPTITYFNNGSVAFSPLGSAGITTININGKQSGNGGPASEPSLAPGQSETVATGVHFQVVHSSDKQEKVFFNASNSSPAFSCVSPVLRLPA